MFAPKTYTRIGGTLSPEFHTCFGPTEVGVTGDDQFSKIWAIEIREDWSVKVYRKDGATFTEISASDFLNTVPVGSRHLTLAFDQQARPSLAYELAGTIYIRQYDSFIGQYVFRDDMTGFDPILLMDASVGLDVADSDVIAFFRSGNDVRYALQRENFSVNNFLETLPDSTYNLDKISIEPYKYQLQLADSTNNELLLTSELYPIGEDDYMSGSSRMVSASLLQNATLYDELSLLSGSSRIVEGRYNQNISIYTRTDSLDGSSRMVNPHNYKLINIAVSPPTNGLDGSSRFVNPHKYKATLIPFSRSDGLDGSSRFVSPHAYKRTVP